MAFKLQRRAFLQMVMGTAAGVSASRRSSARPRPTSDSATIGWPNDVPSWDPNQRFTPDAQPIFKAVFDQPLDQDPQLKLIPHLIKSWSLAPDGLSMAVELRDDVTFHNGDKMTHGGFPLHVPRAHQVRPQARHRQFMAQGGGHRHRIADQGDDEIQRARRRPRRNGWRSSAATSCRRNTSKAGGLDNFLKKPIGTGPYKLAEYELNSRIVLERNDNYWGPKAKVARVTIEIIKDPSARVAAIQSGQADFTVNVPVREVERFQSEGGFAAEINPITRVILLKVRADLAFADKNVRLAAHHAIDKAALSKAFYGGAAVPLSVLATPGTPGYLPDFTFKYDPGAGQGAAGEIGFSPTSRSRSALPRPTANSPATTTSRAPSCRCGRRSASTPTCR